MRSTLRGLRLLDSLQRRIGLFLSTASSKKRAGERRLPWLGAKSSLRYRPDIDGLRALAVTPVVLNHAGVPGFWGGYVGVDIFFVISGYLITKVLLNDIEAETYSIAKFYRRRILRIFPALFAVLAFTTVLAVMFMLPGELRRYASSLTGAAAFFSNIVFFLETGYFEPAARMKPLLHTWSLAIEEQFYVLWPLLVTVLATYRMTALRAAIVAVCVISFAIAVFLVEHNQSAAFYLLPSRAWELGIGGLLAVFGIEIRRGAVA